MLHVVYQALYIQARQSTTGRHAILESTKNVLNTRSFSFSNFVASYYTYGTTRTFLLKPLNINNFA